MIQILVVDDVDQNIKAKGVVNDNDVKRIRVLNIESKGQGE